MATARRVVLAKQGPIKMSESKICSCIEAWIESQERDMKEFEYTQTPSPCMAHAPLFYRRSIMRNFTEAAMHAHDIQLCKIK